VALAFFVSGCAQYRVVPAPEFVSDPAAPVDWNDVVVPGDQIRVYLAEGHVFTGRVVDTTPGEIVLEPVTRSSSEIGDSDLVSCARTGRANRTNPSHQISVDTQLDQVSIPTARIVRLEKSTLTTAHAIGGAVMFLGIVVGMGVIAVATDDLEIM
jgi:hypothetical protein